MKKPRSAGFSLCDAVRIKKNYNSYSFFCLPCSAGGSIICSSLSRSSESRSISSSSVLSFFQLRFKFFSGVWRFQHYFHFGRFRPESMISNLNSPLCNLLNTFNASPSVGSSNKNTESSVMVTELTSFLNEGTRGANLGFIIFNHSRSSGIACGDSRLIWNALSDEYTRTLFAVGPLMTPLCSKCRCSSASLEAFERWPFCGLPSPVDVHFLECCPYSFSSRQFPPYPSK